MPEFIPGLQLAELFYSKAVAPILEARFPGLIYSAARLDFGSDVLGFDTARSMDHGWGPKLTLFLDEPDYACLKDEIVATLAGELPLKLHGFPTNLEGEGGEVWMSAIEQGPVKHGVKVTTPERFFAEYVGIDPLQPIPETAWLAIPQQRLRTIASGRILYDGLGQLEPARRALAWYPPDVWLYVLANQWKRIDQEEPFMGRCGELGDELGSHIVAARQVVELMRLCFLQERSYAPYFKWFGTAFSRLRCAGRLVPALLGALSATSWQERQQQLSNVYLAVARQHNTLGLTPSIEPKLSPFFDRPFLVLHSGEYAEALYAQIQSAAIRAWPKWAGAVWQFADSTDVLESIGVCQALAGAAAGGTDLGLTMELPPAREVP